MIITAATHFISLKKYVIAKLIGLHILEDFTSNSDQYMPIQTTMVHDCNWLLQ